MERKERRHHTREFKLEAVRLAAVGDKTKAKVARELGVRVNQLRQWRLDFEEEERNGVPKQELATAEQDLGTLRRENARLREENEILKKAAVGSTIQRNTFVLMLHFREGGMYGSNGTPRSFRFAEVGALAALGGRRIA
jgi:transposase